jgi:hypothetical protein
MRCVETKGATRSAIGLRAIPDEAEIALANKC